MKGQSKLEDKPLYDTDFVEWCEETAAAIRDGRFDEIDGENLVEEIESLAKRDRRELRSRVIVLIQQLYKWQWQPELRENSTWRATINEQRTQIELLLQDSPSLRRLIEQELETLSSKGYRAAEAEARATANRLRVVRKFSVEDLLNPDYLPKAIDETKKP